MSARHILALDEGTSSTRAIIFDDQGAIAGSAQREFRQIFPSPGLVEHDPVEIWDHQLEVIRGAIQDAGIAPDSIAGIGITNQRETIVLWDRATGEPLHNAIVWQDRRTTARCEQLRSDGCEEMITEHTGLVIDPYFSGTKLEWLLDNVPGARERAERGELAAGTIESWLLWKLTGGRRHATDVSNACRTMLYDIRTGSWSDELLDLLRIPRSLLPEVVPCSRVLGECDRDLFGAEVPVGGMIGDQQSALFGQLCTREGMAKSTYGTGCFLLMNTGEQIVRSKNRLLTTIGWQIGDEPVQHALEGSVFMAGASIQWLRDGLGIIDSAPEVNELASSVPDSGGVQVVPAFAGLGAPYWDPTARGAILGLTRGSTAAHIARATLESLALRGSDVLGAMSGDSGIDLSMLRVDGGAAASDLLMQMQADLLGIPVERPRVLESTALGAGYMAGIAVDVWKDVAELESHREVDRVFEPMMDESTRQGHLDAWRRSVERALHWVREDEKEQA
ncbi:MAG: glycerol kinase GlpK [Phycisphaerales bacterium]|nr:glycerol kinase GlpK [Phycisphaerales bacterium]